MKATIDHLDKITIGKSMSGFFIYIQTTHKNWYLRKDWYLHKDGMLNIICGHDNFHDTFEAAAAFITKLRKELEEDMGIKVKLNDTYTAEVFKDKIVVGSQTFPIDIAKKILNAHNKALGNPTHSIKVGEMIYALKGTCILVPNRYYEVKRVSVFNADVHIDIDTETEYGVLSYPLNDQWFRY